MQRSQITKNLENVLADRAVNGMLNLDATSFYIGLHARASYYLQLYSSFINVGRRFILAHNQFVSIFNLVKGQWTSH